MPQVIGLQRIAQLATIASLCLASCVSVSRTPPLSSQGTGSEAIYHGVAFTSGTFQRPHRVIGIVQMTQEGFRNFLAGEVNEEGTESSEMMQLVARFVANHGADGLQNFSLVEENPRSKEARRAQQAGQVLKLMGALSNNDKNAAMSGYRAGAAEGEETRFHIKGELVAWLADRPDPNQKPAPADLTKEDIHTPNQESN